MWPCQEGTLSGIKLPILSLWEKWERTMEVQGENFSGSFRNYMDIMSTEPFKSWIFGQYQFKSLFVFAVNALNNIKE